MKNKKNFITLFSKNETGFIALTSTLIISSFIVLLLVGSFKTSVTEMDRTRSRENGELSLLLANTCAEKALNALRENPDYGGNESFSFEEGSCEILAIEEENGVKIIKTKGVFSQYEKKMVIETNSEIIKWEDLK